MAQINGAYRHFVLILVIVLEYALVTLHKK